MDLFAEYERLPLEVQAILATINDELDYNGCAEIVQDLEEVGYTCDYDLSATLLGLRVLNCPCCNSVNTRKDYDFENMNCCDDCGADFLNDGEIILDPRTIK
jgi:hypothetical protein